MKSIRDLNAHVQFITESRQQVLLVLQDGGFGFVGNGGLIPAELREDVIRRLVAWATQCAIIERETK
jgi:hypothetical protein